MHKDPNITNQDDRAWQSALKAGKEHLGNLDVNLAFLKKINLFNSNHRILEVGCGIGTIVNWLSQQGYQAFGSDISQTAIEYGRHKYPGINLTVESAQELKWDNGSFDIVLSFDVFEHLFEIDKHLQEVARVLKPRGYYLFQTPNKYSNGLYETIRSRSFQWKRYHPSLHSPRQLKKRLRKHNYSVQFVKMNPVTPFFLKKLQNMPKILQIIRYIPFEKLPMCLQTNLYIVAQKMK